MLQNPFQILLVLVWLGACFLLLNWALALRRKNTMLVRNNTKMIWNIISNIDGGIIAFFATRNFPILYVNNGFLELVGYTRNTFEALEVKNGATFIYPEDVASLENAVLKNEINGSPIEIEMRLLHKKGLHISALFRGTLIKNEDNQPLLYCIVVDVSRHRALIETLHIEKERYRVLVELSNDIIFEVDMRKKTLCCSPRFRETFGWEMEKSDIQETMPYPLRVHPDDEEALRQTVQVLFDKGSNVSSKLRIIQENGDFIWCRLFVTCIRHDGKPLKVIGKIEDIDELVRENMRLELLSQTDGLCGLYNKEALRIATENSLEVALAAGAGSAFFFIDSDNFKLVNDTLGHTVGDRVLQDIASSLKSVFRSNDIIGRFGGDEFCVFIPQMPRSIAEAKAAEIVHRLQGVYTGENGQSVTVSASVGVACSPEAGTTYAELLANADKATYRAKNLGRNQYVFFTPA